MRHRLLCGKLKRQVAVCTGLLTAVGSVGFFSGPLRLDYVAHGPKSTLERGCKIVKRGVAQRPRRSSYIESLGSYM